jgi:hypothetical protein
MSIPIDPRLLWEIAQTTIQLAPRVADGAQKLWSGMRKKSALEKSPESGSDDAKNSDIKPEITIDTRVLAAESSIHDLQSEMLASTELIKALADQNAQFAKYIEASRLQFETLGNENGILIKRVESDSELLNTLEAKNAQLAKNVEVERMRVNRLTGICVTIGLMATTALALAMSQALR